MSQIVFHFERASKDYQFTTGYCELNRSSCVECNENITKDELQLGVLEQSMTHDERRPKWYHVACFFEKFHLQYAESIDGFCKLRTKHQSQIRKFLMDGIEPDGAEIELQKLMENQNEDYFKLREQLKAKVSPDILKSILKINKQAIPEDLSELLEHCADVIYFGAMVPCEKCKNGKFRIGNSKYVCDGYINDWVECDNVVIKPERNNVLIQSEYKNAHPFLAIQFKKRTRFYNTAGVVPKSFWARPQADLSRYYKNIKPIDIDIVNTKSGLENKAHIYYDKNQNYSAILSFVDITHNKNSYYQIQLLESNDHKCCWVFENWGRILTIIGSTALKKFSHLDSAKKFFETNYLCMTNNSFYDEYFIKFPGKYYEMDIDISSKLEKSVQHLIQLISKTIKKIPGTHSTALGKISEKQVCIAHRVLLEISWFIHMGSATYQDFVGASNHFHTLIPGEHGVINDILAVDYCMKKLKAEMKPYHNHSLFNTIFSNYYFDSDKFYKTLNCDIRSIDKKSEEFELLKQCFDNTNILSDVLKIKEIFTVSRHGEEARFEPFKRLHRCLLWHGSDIAHFNGILKNGLKIQPAEAKRCDQGWFGKGIYFADMVSNSIIYCSRYGPMRKTGLMLLCEVALGDIMDLKNIKYLNKLPAGKNSVKGLGVTNPHPSGFYKFSDGAFINKGTKIVRHTQYEIKFNEFVVFNPAQVKLRYIFQFKQ